MKEYLLSVVGEGSKKHSTFKNPNEVLQQQIANFSVEGDITMKIFHTPSIGYVQYTVGELVGDEYKLSDGKNILYYPKDKVHEELSKDLEMKRNLAFPITNYFKDMYNILYHSRSVAELEVFNMTTDFSHSSDPTAVRQFGVFYNYIIDYICGDLIFKMSVNGRMAKIFFDTNGNIVNRDYNIELQLFSDKEVKPYTVFEEFKKRISSSFGDNIEYFENKYYTNNTMYEMFVENDSFGFIGYPIRSDGKSYQKYKGDTIYKKPKKAVSVDIEHVINTLWSRLSERQLGLLSDDFLNYNIMESE